MKKLPLLLLIICIVSSCQLRLTRPLKGKYPGDYTLVSDKATDQLWDDIIRYCAVNHIKVKIADRKSGLIVSDWYEIDSYTFETKAGDPKHADSKVILGCESREPFKNNCKIPTIIWAHINVKLKKESNQTAITVRLSDLVAWYNVKRYLKEIKSTGVLEKHIINQVR